MYVVQYRRTKKLCKCFEQELEARTEEFTVFTARIRSDEVEGVARVELGRNRRDVFGR